MSKNRELSELIGNAGGTSEQVLSGRRNLIINGGFDVWQRGTVFSGNSYNADRWYSYLSNASVTYANTLNDGNYVHIAVNSGTSIATIEQRLENPAQYHNKTLTLSYNVFGTPTATNGLKYEIALNHDGGRTVINSGSASVGAGRKVLTFSVGDLSGYTLSFSSYLEIRPLIYYQENTWTGAIGISEVQLELGSVATPFEHRSYGEELALCQRYYHRLTHGGTNYIQVGTAMGAGATTAYTAIYHPVEMRATPTFSWSGDLVLYTGSANLAVTAISGTRQSTRVGEVQTTVDTGLTKGYAYKLQFQTAGDRHLTWDAEL